MVIPRYNDKSKLIIENHALIDGEVLIYEETDAHDAVAVCLGKEQDLEAVKPDIAFIARNLCEMDLIAQKFDAFRGGEKFVEENEIGYVKFSGNEITVTYFGTVVNTEFDVVFARKNGGFALKSFGMLKNIPDDWENKKR